MYMNIQHRIMDDNLLLPNETNPWDHYPVVGIVNNVKVLTLNMSYNNNSLLEYFSGYYKGEELKLFNKINNKITKQNLEKYIKLDYSNLKYYDVETQKFKLCDKYSNPEGIFSIDDLMISERWIRSYNTSLDYQIRRFCINDKNR